MADLVQSSTATAAAPIGHPTAMTRRERHLRIIENFGRDRARYHLAEVLARHGLSLLTDEGIEKLTLSIVRSHKTQQRYNREYRARRSS